MSFSSFTSLHIFAQIAGCLSFKEAAEALHLTQSALSHRIRKLEQELGFQLFVRQTRRIALTPEGERLYREVSRHFASVCHEIEDIRHQALRGTLEVGSTPTFAQHWLVPRLGRFYQRHPDLGLQLRSKGSRVDFALHPADLWIDYGDGHYPGLDSRLLLDEVLLPVCSRLMPSRWGCSMRRNGWRRACCCTMSSRSGRAIHIANGVAGWRLPDCPRKPVAITTASPTMMPPSSGPAPGSAWRWGASSWRGSWWPAAS